EQFQADDRTGTADFEHRRWMQSALDGYQHTRDGVEADYRDHARARDTAAASKWEAIEHLDTLLEESTSRLEARGTQICWADHGGEAVEYIRAVCRDANAKKIVKSKCMTTEEIHLNAALERDGLEVVESDLGEFI